MNNRSIWHLYTPIQPAVSSGRRDIVYQELVPEPRLQNFIYCYWQLKTVDTLDEPFYYRVASDSCMDLFFDLNRPTESFVTGFAGSYIGFTLGKEFNYIGIRFLPSVFPQLFRINASDLTGSVEALESVVPELSRFIGNMFEAITQPVQIKSIFDNYFLNLISNIHLQPDTRLYAAINAILQAKGNLKIGKDLDIYLSHRQLRRLFKSYIGGTPKSFSRIIRFQHVLRSALLPAQHYSIGEAGYSDQAHLIREFRNFYGSTPGRLFSS